MREEYLSRQDFEYLTKEELADIVWLLCDKLNVTVVKEVTPDYTIFSLYDLSIDED